MPNYKTHSVHGDLILPSIDARIEIDSEDLKTYCMGPDAMICTNYKLFLKQHESNVKLYFETLLKKVKENKLQDNSEVMAYLYGQLDHYILDVVMHPYINYFEQKLTKTNLIDSHALIEMWMDDYVINKYNNGYNLCYKKRKISDKRLKELIDYIYKEVYNSSCMSLKYNLGIKFVSMFDSLIRCNSIKIAKLLLAKLNIGDITYHDDYTNVIPYLNLNNDIWKDMEIGEEHKESFDDLWIKSIDESLETIDAVNKYLYSDANLNCKYIKKNISYNTGLPCKK